MHHVSISGIFRVCNKPLIPKRMVYKTGQHTQMMGCTGELNSSCLLVRMYWFEFHAHFWEREVALLKDSVTTLLPQQAQEQHWPFTCAILC